MSCGLKDLGFVILSFKFIELDVVVKGINMKVIETKLFGLNIIFFYSLLVHVIFKAFNGSWVHYFLRLILFFHFLIKSHGVILLIRSIIFINMILILISKNSFESILVILDELDEIFISNRSISIFHSFLLMKCNISRVQGVTHILAIVSLSKEARIHF